MKTTTLVDHGQLVELMKGELSHGLPGLATAGNRILRRDTREPVWLRGINRSGLEYAEPGTGSFLEAAGISRREMEEMVVNWRANVIRVPFNQDWALNGRNARSAEEYRAALDQVIEWAAGLGAYTILDLQWLDSETVYGHASGRENFVAPTPNAETIRLWAELAERYREEPAVLFDLFNEPHDPVEDDVLPIHLIAADGSVLASGGSSVTAKEWRRWAERLAGEIRRVHADSLIFVSGVDWGFDLRGVEVDAPNIVYSTHIYANRRRSVWRKALARAATAPVFVGEWGGGAEDLEFGRRLLEATRPRGCGWTAWSWADHPRLIESPGPPDYRPTAFGELVRKELQRSGT